MSRFYGHSLMELYWPAPGEKKGVTNLIPRKHVKPKFGIVTKQAYDITGLPYREAPFNEYCIEVGKCDDLGLILEACPYVIFKRGGFGDWAEFAEVFGMPFRWATYNNELSRKILETALSQAGAAGYVVAPEDAKLEFHNPTAGGQSNDIFRFLIEACNQEISVTILGNTMTTTEAKHSGYAQSETQMKTQDEIHKDDRAFVLTILNERLTEYLLSLGYPVRKGEWCFEDGDGLSLTDRLTIDMKIAEKGVPIAIDYWYDKYMIPKPKPGEITEMEPAEDDPEDGMEDAAEGEVADKKKPAKPGKP
jgi:phage gp29-like protein